MGRNWSKNLSSFAASMAVGFAVAGCFSADKMTLKSLGAKASSSSSSSSSETTTTVASSSNNLWVLSPIEGGESLGSVTANYKLWRASVGGNIDSGAAFKVSSGSTFKMKGDVNGGL